MIKNLFLKYKEIIVYLVFGVLTTAVNLISFYLLEKFNTGVSYLINNWFAWVIAVIFAYITNKLYVFNSKSFSPKLVLREAGEFLGARIFSFLVEEAGMWFFVDLLNLGLLSYDVFGFNLTGKMISKIVLAVIVVILNYFFSKFIIFKTNAD